MNAALAFFGLALGFALYALARRAADPASTGDADLARSAEGAASGLVEALGRTVTTLWSAPAAAAPWREAIAQAEQRYGIPQDLLLRQLDIESDHFDPDVVYGRRTSSAGAIGIAQFEPPTAAQYGVDPFDPMSSIDGAARYMRDLFRQFGAWGAALAAYNWGPGHVARQGADAAPKETRNYVAAILSAVGLGS